MILSNSTSRHIFAGLAVLGLMAGCAEVTRTRFPVNSDTQTSNLPANVRVIPLTPENIDKSWQAPTPLHSVSKLPTSRADWQYAIGAGDVLNITVWDHPELINPAGTPLTQAAPGITVNARGDIFYPYLGHVHVEGRRTSDVQQDLTNRLQKFITDPQIEVRVAAFNAHKVIITGTVSKPQSLPISNIPLSLMEAINATGGGLKTADMHHVSIRRDGAVHTVDLANFLDNGKASNNPILHGGDIINIPQLPPKQAYILGQIKAPGIVPLNTTGMSLTEALAKQGGLNEARADASGIFVFRNKRDGINVYQLDATTPLAFVLATRFILRPDDVVYVVADPAAQWNAIISQLIPTIGAVRQAQLIGKSL